MIKLVHSGTPTRPPLDELIDAACELEPGPEAWAPIFRHYPELSVEQVDAAFRASAERSMAEAAAFKEWRRRRFGKGDK